MRGNAISGDGSVIVGEADDRSVSPTELFVENRAAFRWTAGSGLSRLADLSAAPLGGVVSHSKANGISRDGATAVGESRGINGFVQAVYWRGGVIAGLGFLPGANVFTRTVTDPINGATGVSALADARTAL